MTDQQHTPDTDVRQAEPVGIYPRPNDLVSPSGSRWRNGVFVRCYSREDIEAIKAGPYENVRARIGGMFAVEVLRLPEPARTVAVCAFPFEIIGLATVEISPDAVFGIPRLFPDHVREVIEAAFLGVMYDFDPVAFLDMPKDEQRLFAVQIQGLDPAAFEALSEDDQDRISDLIVDGDGPADAWHEVTGEFPTPSPHRH